MDTHSRDHPKTDTEKDGGTTKQNNQQSGNATPTTNWHDIRISNLTAAKKLADLYERH